MNLLGIPPIYYYTVHHVLFLFVTLFYFSQLNAQRRQPVVQKIAPGSIIYGYLFFFVIVFGLRPIDGVFGDTISYADTYAELQKGYLEILLMKALDILWAILMYFCAQVMDVEWFYLIVMLLFMAPVLKGVRRMTPQVAPLLLVFYVGGFVFMGSAVNGLRNAIALSFVLLAITYIDGRFNDKLKCMLLLLCAVGFHKSAFLPAMCLIFVKMFPKPKMMFVAWFLSIAVSLTLGNSFSSMFQGLGYDDRMDNLLDPDSSAARISKVGFRWDFLLYSSMPVLLGWYVLIKRKLTNRLYLLMFGTYIFANAFWILVIRIPFSNRVAGLSWFLYPLLLAYPLVTMPVFKKNHYQKTALILLAHYAFTFFMWIIS